MTEIEFIAMARSYGLRASEPVKYGYNYEHNYVNLYLGVEFIGKITDVIVFGKPEESGRTFIINYSSYQIQRSSDSCVLKNMTEEKFKDMLLSCEKLTKQNLETRRNGALELIGNIETLQSKLGFAKE